MEKEGIVGTPKSKVAEVVVRGPLAPFCAVYLLRLAELGYTPLTMVNEMRQVAHLSRWMTAVELEAADLTAERVVEFLEARRAAGHQTSLRGLMLLLAAMDDAGVLDERLLPAAGPADDALLAKFRQHLLAERGLAECTTEAYLARARRFLAGCPDLGSVTSADVTAAVQREALRVSIGSTQYFVAGLRAFLRFCFVEGIIGADLSAAALAVTGRRRSSLPKGIAQGDAARMLKSCDRRRSDGQRDYAILLVLLRLGLRAGEVARLTLEDIDWRSGEVVVHGKGRRVDRLPLPGDVGEALVAYLRRGRPCTARRELFLRTIAPIGPLGRGGISSVVRRACRRAGVAEIGAHRLRHTVACQMIASGVALSNIALVLRQRAASSTSLYARVDVEALRTLAPPWPGVQQW
jgi:site-specific recombinase XerD